MKKILVFLLVLGIGLNLNSQSRKERRAAKEAALEAKYESIKSLLESSKFHFEAQWANPIGNDAVRIGQSLTGAAGVFQGNRVSLIGNPNHVKINIDQADIFLPYFGRVFFANKTSTQGGINYKGQIKDYSRSINDKKKVITVKFKAVSKTDNLDFILKVTASGKATLNVNSINRQTISYDGSIRALQQESDH